MNSSSSYLTSTSLNRDEKLSSQHSFSARLPYSNNNNNSFGKEDVNLLELAKNIQKNKKKKLAEKCLSPPNSLTLKKNTAICGIEGTSNNKNENKFVKIRFLLFVEDSSGCRSNIFDSAQANCLSGCKTMDSPSSPTLPGQSSLLTNTSPKLNNEVILHPKIYVKLISLDEA